MNVWNEPCKLPVSAPFLLGLCPALAACDTFFDGLLLGLTTLVVFALTVVVAYLLRGVVSGAARTVVVIMTAAALSGIAVLLVEAYFPVQYDVIGLYLPLTALQCVALDRILAGRESESVSKLSGPAAGYVLTLCALGLLREFLGAGTLFGAQVLPSDMEPVTLFHSAPGAFLALAFLFMGANAYGILSGRDGEEESK